MSAATACEQLESDKFDQERSDHKSRVLTKRVEFESTRYIFLMIMIILTKSILFVLSHKMCM